MAADVLSSQLSTRISISPSPLISPALARTLSRLGRPHLGKSVSEWRFRAVSNGETVSLWVKAPVAG
jgi:hypothetical protein